MQTAAKISEQLHSQIIKTDGSDGRQGQTEEAGHKCTATHIFGGGGGGTDTANFG